MKKFLFPFLGAFSLALLLSSSSPKDALLFLAAALLHETGHLFACLSCGSFPRAFSLSPGGLTLFPDLSFLPYKKEILLYLAGPFANAVGAAVSFFLIREKFSMPLLYFFFCNALFFTFNLLPIRSLDGYQALFSFLSLLSSPEEARRILTPVSFIFSLLLLFLGIGLFLLLKNVSLLLFSVFLLADGQTKKATKLS